MTYEQVDEIAACLRRIVEIRETRAKLEATLTGSLDEPQQQAQEIVLKILDDGETSLMNRVEGLGVRVIA